MRKTTDEFRQFVETADVRHEVKSELHNYLSRFEKLSDRLDFQIKRTLEDKTIVINLLNKTIEDLRAHQAIIEKSNKELSFQKEEIQAKNLVLQSQKLLLEEQSKKLEENLHELEMSFIELEQFSFIASHDLKSPLRTIASYAGLLKRRYFGKLDTDADEFLNFIVKGASHMNEIIRDLLEYSRSGKEKEFDKTNLNDTLELVKFNLRSEIIENEAIIEYPPLPELYVHKSGMLQLFQNLVGNAIKFRGEQPPHITIHHGQQQTYWHFTVSDNGLGLDETFQEKAFQPFQRINHLDRPGTGMGLAICRKIVKMHKGDIWYESSMGNGTTFKFTISQEIPTENTLFYQKGKKIM